MNAVADTARREPTATVATPRAYLLLAVVIVLWGANWPVMKVGLDSIPPLWFAVARLVLGAVALFLVLATTRRLVLPSRHDLPILLSVGVLQMGGFLILINLGLERVPAGRSAVLAYTTPLWVAPGAVLLLQERLGRFEAIGLGLGLAGIALLFNPAEFPWADRRAVIGNLLLMLAALSWACAILHARAHRWRASPLQLAPWQMLIAIPPVLVLALALEDWGRIRWTGELMLVLAYNGPIATAFCYWAAVTVTRALPAVSTSLGFLGVPVTGVLFAAATLGEPLGAGLMGGLLLIIGGLALVNTADLRRARINHQK